MIEAMLWTMAEPLLAAQTGTPAAPQGDRSPRHAQHRAFRCAGDDAWVAVVADRPGLAEATLADRLSRQDAAAGAAALLGDGVAAAALASSLDLVASEHLRQRGFWDAQGVGVLPGLPWHASFERRSGAAPALGADTDAVLTKVLALSRGEIAALREQGALG